MNKAFVKEDAQDLEEDVAELPVGHFAEKNYITPAGFLRLKEELRALVYDERPSVVDTVAWAAANGDRSENADYIYGKRRLREIDRRIRFLMKRVESAEVVDHAGTTNREQVFFGATVEVMDEEGSIQCYCIVGEDETDPHAGKISWTSPLARAFLSRRVGDEVHAHTPAGERIFEIQSINYLK